MNTPISSPRPRGPKGHRVTADQILEAAAKVFSEEGLQASSLRTIAKAAGCDPALIYYHFESKEAMFMALLDRCIPELSEALQHLAREADARPMPYRFRDALALYRRHTGHHAGLRAIIRGEITRGTEGLQDRLAEKIRATSGAIWTLIRQGIQRGELREDLLVELTGFFFIKLYLEILDVLPAMAPRVAGIPSDQAVAQAERAWLELFWRGVAADPTVSLPSDLFE